MEETKEKDYSISKKSKLYKGLIEIDKKLDQMPDWMKRIYGLDDMIKSKD